MRTLIRSGRVFDPASGEIADADIAIDGGTYLDSEAVDLMSTHGTWLVPTLGVAHQIRESIEAAVRRDPPQRHPHRSCPGIAAMT